MHDIALWAISMDSGTAFWLFWLSGRGKPMTLHVRKWRETHCDDAPTSLNTVESCGVNDSPVVDMSGLGRHHWSSGGWVWVNDPRKAHVICSSLFCEDSLVRYTISVLSSQCMPTVLVGIWLQCCNEVNANSFSVSWTVMEHALQGICPTKHIHHDVNDQDVSSCSDHQGQWFLFEHSEFIRVERWSESFCFLLAVSAGSNTMQRCCEACPCWTIERRGPAWRSSERACESRKFTARSLGAGTETIVEQCQYR